MGAINGGKGWLKVLYKNHQIELKGGIGIAMGTYDFTCATTGDVSTVEYTFGYARCNDGKVRIFLHHSSVPYSAAPAPVTEAEVLEVQKKWANAIKTISKTHKDGGDYIQAAADAAGELYAYGHSDVMFKPTKAAEFPFRPTPEEAMSLPWAPMTSPAPPLVRCPQWSTHSATLAARMARCASSCTTPLCHTVLDQHQHQLH